MSKVALIRCEGYDYLGVKAAIERGLDLIGGPQQFANPGENILLKPNLLVGEPPEKCVTTHPLVFKAVAEVFKSTGAKLTYGDSPAIGSPEGAARKAGLTAVASELGIEMADFVNGHETFCEECLQNKKFIIAKGALAADGIVSLPKLKTHGLTRLTGSIKNQFGCIPGVLKGEFHVKLPKVENFAQMLVDLNILLKPRLFVMDGIMAMEGNGPRGGRPRAMNILLLSSDPVALDSIVCRLVSLHPSYVPTIELGMRAKIGTFRDSEIELVGDDINSFISKGFDVKREPAHSREIPRMLNNLLVPKPVINESKCVQCGICVNACPVAPKVVDWAKGDKTKAPVYDYNRCIRCYCCQEMCPESAITVNSPFLRRTLSRLKRK
ncbi:MAG: DUF362 domain-containing protein [Candidatus Saccharibacteria bacterium]